MARQRTKRLTDPATIPLSPPMRKRTAEIYEVIIKGVMEKGTAVIRYRYRPNSSGPEMIGATIVNQGEWPDGYWPPAVGDVVSVEERPKVELTQRPRRI